MGGDEVGAPAAGGEGEGFLEPSTDISNVYLNIAGYANQVLRIKWKCSCDIMK